MDGFVKRVFSVCVLIGHEYGSIAMSVFRASKCSDAMFLNILVNLWNSLRFTLAFKLRNVVAFMQFPTLTHELSMNCDIVSPHNLKSLVYFGIT